MANFYGSICLTDIPKDQIKKITCKDGVTRLFIPFYLNEMRNPDQQGNTHTMKVAVKKDEQDPNVNYYFGKAKVQEIQQQTQQPTQAEIESAESLNADDVMPF